MEQKSGQLIINEEGKLILTGEVFDGHDSYDFSAYVDTGSSFGITLTRELADAVCAKVEEEINICVGGGETVCGHKRIANLRFGGLVLNNYEITVLDGGVRNIIGIRFLQDNNIVMLVDFKEKTQGGSITSNRKTANILGKAMHCLLIHNVDITKSDEPCPVCGAKG